MAKSISRGLNLISSDKGGSTFFVFVNQILSEVYPRETIFNYSELLTSL